MPEPTVVSRLATLLTYPLRLEDFLAVIDPRHSSRQLRGTISAVTPEAPGVSTIAIHPGRGWRPHRAGQWLRVGVEIAGVRHWRPFSISSAEGADPTITVGSVGLVSEHLVRRARPGDLVFLDLPQGDFVLPDAPGPLLLVGAGTGVTPLMAMLRTALARDAASDIVFVHVARTRADAIFAAELAALAARHPSFRLVSHHSAASGRLDLTSPAALAALVPDWRDRSTFVCGPPGLIEDAEGLWAAAAASDLTVERFTLTRRVDPDAAGGRVTFARSGKVTDAAGARPLLEVGEDAGVPLPCGCRMGICRTCLTRLAEGQVRDLTTGRVHGEPGDLIRTCVSAAAGDVRLDA